MGRDAVRLGQRNSDDAFLRQAQTMSTARQGVAHVHVPILDRQIGSFLHHPRLLLRLHWDIVRAIGTSANYVPIYAFIQHNFGCVFLYA